MVSTLNTKIKQISIPKKDTDAIGTTDKKVLPKEELKK